MCWASVSARRRAISRSRWAPSPRLAKTCGRLPSTSQTLTAIDVPPGASIDVSVELRAPQEPGTYRGYWGLKNTNGLEFGVGPSAQPFYVEIKVVE